MQIYQLPTQLIKYLVNYKNQLYHDTALYRDYTAFRYRYSVSAVSHITRMDLIHYSFAPLILFRVPYTLDLLPEHLSIANGAGGVGIFELLVFQCFVQKLLS